MTAPLTIEEFARRLGLDYVPGDRQRAIITAPTDRPALVVAGAGAGKTETMSLRAAWLVAGGVPANEILGLTFTRKAAGELAERMRRFADRARAVPGSIDELLSDVDVPIVSTYNAWAASVYREHALAIGREPDAEVIGEAAAWRLARRVVAEHGGHELIRLGRRAGQVASIVVELSNAITDNLADPDEVRRYASRFVDLLGDLPLGGNGAYAEVDRHVDAVSALEVLVPLVEQYRIAKRRRGLIEFSDQVSAAVEICEARPEVAAELRERHRHVILDEYQDTSVVQTRLLATVFRGGDVMAVGDPNQSIYGWRGASAANLAEFAETFGATSPPFVLAVSRRNPARVLDAANELSKPLRDASPIIVPELEPKPDAPIGAFDVRYPETVDDEAVAVADWMAERIGDGREADRPTAAIVFRARKHMIRFQRALRERGVRSHILGGGGLLSSPEVTDLVACLRVLVDPEAGSDLIRLLSGARWRIGLRDLAELEHIARWLAERDHAHRRLDDEVLARLRDSAVPSEASSIVDALDFIVDAPDGHRLLGAITQEGLSRLRAAGAELRRLRHKLGLPLPDLVRHVEEVMRLDIEAVANDTRWGGPSNLRAFRQQVEGFTRVDDDATLRSFLDWVDRVREDDREIALDDAPREPGVVQLITIHGAKGLEWDIVAIPRLVFDEMPDEPAVGSGWVGYGRLPSELRGDRRHVPHLDWIGSESRVDYLERLEQYREALKAAHRAEYRRLIYVAITRTKRDLLLSGSWWGGQRKPRPPSTYLQELAERGLLGSALPEVPADETDPRADESEQQEWPRDPLGARRPRVVAAAAAFHGVLDAVSDGAEDTNAELDSLVESADWAADLALLLAEHEARSIRALPAIPARIPASGFKHWIDDARGVLDRMRRPMPEQPHRATRIGTVFHAWVEHRYQTNMPESLLSGVRWEDGVEDGAPGLDEAASELLERCKANFLQTRWAGLQPVDVERAIELPFAGRIIPCKIDAVFDVDGRIEIVDWKTGRRPADAAGLAAFDYQLDLYRLAWSDQTGTSLEQIRARAVFVAIDDAQLRDYLPERPRSRAELDAEWQQATDLTAGG
ncbi:MAG TPA: ATP-dependent DNA helicase [Microbacteriaceae bacterium]|nr:ATP-dependent DNA helicase [Microbacteriaceae bacterium]